MNLTKFTKSEIVQTKQVPGLLDTHIAYEIKSAKGRLDYTGPTIDPLTWHQILSFFRWTNKEMHSESQVRMYVNLKLGRWGAWAFPQEARTGMTARELDVKESPAEAVMRFASWRSEPSDDWTYFATIHHHCGAGAFQSGTDESNERGQDGLHLTVGKVDEQRHDLHGRFYIDENCYEPDMSRFWDIGDTVRQLVPAELHDGVARYQMCESVPVDFPDQWRKNVVEIKREPIETCFGYHTEIGMHNHLPLGKATRTRQSWERVEAAIEHIQREMISEEFTEEVLHETLEWMARVPVAKAIIEACLLNDVEPEAIIDELASNQTLQADREKSIHQLTDDEYTLMDYP